MKYRYVEIDENLSSAGYAIILSDQLIRQARMCKFLFEVSKQAEQEFSPLPLYGGLPNFWKNVRIEKYDIISHGEDSFYKIHLEAGEFLDWMLEDIPDKWYQKVHEELDKVLES